MKIFILILFFSCIYISSIAQPTDTLRLDDIYVYSDLLEIRQKETLRSLSFITAEQISNSNFTTTDEILRFIPGLETQSRNLYGVQSDFSIRGSTFNQVLVLIDGIRLNDPLTGHFSSYLPVTLSEIARIEVIRGPASIIYGPDAVGGVINIITKNAGLNTDSVVNVNIRAGGGRYELINTDAGLSGSSGKFNYNAGVKLLSSGGYPASDGHRYDFRLRTAAISLSFPVGEKWKFSGRIAIDGREFSARRFYTISPYDSARENVKTWWNHLNGTHYGSSSITIFDLAYKNTSDEYVFNSQTPANYHTTKQIITQIASRSEINRSINLTTGIQSYYRSIVSNDRGDHNEISGGLFGMCYISINENINSSGGLRLEYDKHSGVDILPQANLSFNKGIFSLRGLAGKTIRTPDFTERYISTNLSSLAPGRNLGNPDLIPEKSWSFEAGSVIHPVNNLSLEVTLFKRFGYELIDYVLTQGSEIVTLVPLIPDGRYFYAKNIKSLSVNGVEFILNASYDAGKEGKILSTMGYSFQIPESSTGEISKYISNQAHQLFVFNTRYSAYRMGFSLNGMYRQRNTEYASAMDLSLSSRYWLFNTQLDFGIVPKRLYIELRIENIFNTKYSDILGAELPRRWISGGIKYRKN